MTCTPPGLHVQEWNPWPESLLWKKDIENKFQDKNKLNTMKLGLLKVMKTSRTEFIAKHLDWMFYQKVLLYPNVLHQLTIV